ncbi:NAD-dependent epimerase/dehydratase family protein [Streptomyces sp. NEAU-YJ-81]|uniref:NAD-dependent epimerase/dehydratase family protein n=1 Tax=Streptomyces sp. NEAU-YJ-81 TaxID=2820288 RepID=UPI001ABC8D80|nr:NAD-dependent epimerase/dehydratase family protein [Streptomyces sp. NEAU-YJ-81]MBO3678340.1 NAD-dependent epimerase/dehydratase family protein [Streptomyces sp. NEAU-YJ-81]
MHVFVTGASGYIGGTVAVRLLRAGHHVSGLTRDPAKAGQLARLGIEPVVGSLDDADLLAARARRADAVVNAADSDHRAAVDTLIAALAGSGKALIHTSGSSTVGTGTEGEASEVVYDEGVLDPGSAWEPDHPIRAARVAIDRLVLGAAEREVRSAVLCDSLIYGHGRGPGRDSVLIAALVRQARAGGVVRHVGPGRNIWSTVHVDDVADLYLLALEKTPPGAFYFVENGEESFGAIAEAIARSLGLPGPRPWDPDAPDNVWNPQFARHALGSNSRVRARRARALLGWDPRHRSIADWILRELR